jgi:hypothetical protein
MSFIFYVKNFKIFFEVLKYEWRLKYEFEIIFINFLTHFIIKEVYCKILTTVKMLDFFSKIAKIKLLIHGS